jgi:hypothetical protein
LSDFLRRQHAISLIANPDCLGKLTDSLVPNPQECAMATTTLFPELPDEQDDDSDAGAIRRYSIIRDLVRELRAARARNRDSEAANLGTSIVDALVELDEMRASLLLKLPNGTLIELH